MDVPEDVYLAQITLRCRPITPLTQIQTHLDHLLSKKKKKKHSRKCPLMEAVPESELLYNSSPVV